METKKKVLFLKEGIYMYIFCARVTLGGLKVHNSDRNG